MLYQSPRFEFGSIKRHGLMCQLTKSLDLFVFVKIEHSTAFSISKELQWIKDRDLLATIIEVFT